MLKQLANLRKRHYALVAVAIVGVVWLAFIINRTQKPALPLTVPQLYQKELTSLSNDLTELGAYIDQKREINEDLNEYTTGLNNLKNPCRQMNIYHDRYRDEALSDQIKDAMSNTRQLCLDFLEVLDYSQAIFRVTGPYLTMDTKHWPYAGSAEFTGHMQSIDKTISGTLDELKNVKNTVEDPAIHELTAQLQLAQAKLKQVQDAKAKNDTAAADKYTGELVALINQDKIDFINARTYFWRNTVGLDALQRSVQALSSSF